MGDVEPARKGTRRICTLNLCLARTPKRQSTEKSRIRPRVPPAITWNYRTPGQLVFRYDKAAPHPSTIPPENRRDSGFHAPPALLEDSTMKNYYYSDENSKPIGPVSIDELDALFAKQQINHSTPVIGEGDEKWSEYRTIQRVKAIEASPTVRGIRYDPKVIQKFADLLYSRADFIVMKYVLIFLLIGAVFGAVALGVAMNSIPFGVAGMILGALLGGAIGYSTGQAKAFVLRLHAQGALCMIQIENNTRS